MAFNLYSGNQLELLLEKYLNSRSLEKNDPFKKDIIIVQSQGMATWVKQEIAANCGIFANTEFPFLNGVIEKILNEQDDGFNAELWTPDFMSWRIFNLLKLQDSNLETLENYTKGENSELKTYQLANKTANLFDQYQIYRPDLINDWEENRLSKNSDKNEIWQKYIWNKLSDGQVSRTKRLLNFKDNPFKTKNYDELNIFGISVLPPIYLDFFKNVAQFIDVNFYYFNPSFDYWKDNLSDFEKQFRADDENYEGFELHLGDTGNPLFANLGRQGREFFSTIVDAENIDSEIDLFDKFTGNNILTNLKNDIFENKSIDENFEKSEYAKNDSSVQIHNCHNKTREVEVLHDYILNLIDKKGVQPRDIIVMAPNMSDYASYVKTFFNERVLPYTITDQTMLSDSVIFNAYMEILNLVGSDFKANDVLDILQHPSIYTMFEIEYSDFDLIKKWLNEAGVRWGIDAKSRAENSSLEFDAYSWRYSLKRMVLGMAMNNQDDDVLATLVDDVLPYDEIEGNNAIILGQLVDVVEKLFMLNKTLNGQKTLEEWSEKLINVLDTFFMNDNDSYDDIAFIRQSLTKLNKFGECFGENMVSLEIIKEYLNSGASTDANSSKFLRGKITFCSMLPMRSIPSESVCILGLNDGEYPRKEISLGFNIISNFTRKCDRSKRYEDQYLFLEALLSAKENLFISYHGQSIKDNSDQPPSTVVCELIDYLKLIYGEEVLKHIECKHKLQSFNPVYFGKDEKLYSYNKINYEAARTLLAKKDKAQFQEGSLETGGEMKEITIDELVSFFSNPAEGFLKNALQMQAKLYTNDILEDTEPLELDTLSQYSINQEISDFIIKNVDLKDEDKKISLKNKLKYSQKLQANKLGEYNFEKTFEEIREFLEAKELLKNLRESSKEKVEIIIDNIKITGEMNINQNENTVHCYRYADRKGKDVIRAYLLHLIANIAYKEVTTFLYSKLPKTPLKLKAKTQEDAKSLLKEIIEIYKECQQKTLKFFCGPAYKYAMKADRGKPVSQDEKIKAAIDDFSPWDAPSFAECNNDAIKTCFENPEAIIRSGEFAKLAKILFAGVYRPAKEEVEEA